MTTDLRRISNSELRTWKRCRRKWYLTYYRKLKLRRESATGPAAVGTRVHAILASYYTVGKDRVPEIYLSHHDELVDYDLLKYPDDADTIRKEADLSRAILEGYFQWVEETGADEGLIVVAPEQKLEAEVAGVILQGKIDVRVRRDVDGARMVLDHKTCQDFSIANGLERDEQGKTYLLLERLTSDEVTDGFIYNMLRKVKRTATARPPFYDRVEVRHNVHVMRDFYERVVHEIADIVDRERLLDSGSKSAVSGCYPNPTRDCRWDCPFVGVCALMDDPTAKAEQLIEALYEEGDPYARYQDGDLPSL